MSKVGKDRVGWGDISGRGPGEEAVSFGKDGDEMGVETKVGRPNVEGGRRYNTNSYRLLKISTTQALHTALLHLILATTPWDQYCCHSQFAGILLRLRADRHLSEVTQKAAEL